MDYTIDHIYRFGDQYQLNLELDLSAIKADIERFSDCWLQYNRSKLQIPRYGLNVLNLTGDIVEDSPALDSIIEWNRKHGTSYTELDFDKPTELYNTSIELQRTIGQMLPWCIRTHFIKLPPGGFFPPHRDFHGREQSSFRIIVPIENVNPPLCRFIIEDKSLYWNPGAFYVVNTTKSHTLFNPSDSLDSTWLVINAKICQESVDFVRKNLSY
jgi:hypothetical protein